MGDPKGFLTIPRKEAGNRPVTERIYDFGEVEQILNTEDRKLQASRCMDCGVPFCHWGCPVINLIPEWQDMLYRGEWKKASDLLHATNNFPEVTGRICSAPCEDACVLTLHEAPVTIRENEVAIAEMAFREGYITPRPPKVRTGKKVAVIGSGPAGLACADLLNKWGYWVTVFEKEDAAGGLMRYGIPDFKLSKKIIDRRIDLFIKEGLIIRLETEIGKDVDPEQLLLEYDVVCLAIGAEQPRDLPVNGRDLNGIHFAMEYLKQQNKINNGIEIPYDYLVSAKDKNVVILGGGDTGSDCVGTAIRQGARKITQIEILPQPDEVRIHHNPSWPYMPKILKTSTSHEEGCERRWSLSTRRFLGEQKLITGLEIVRVDWELNEEKQFVMTEIPGTLEIIKADLVLLALGFLHPVHEGLVNKLGLELDNRKNIKVNSHLLTSNPKVFACGDAKEGASLVVKAIHSGRRAAQAIHRFLEKDKS
ncbi:MAG: glutamate synthase [Bacteroides sp. SM23_62_1]|nr:MAG: glutamate synthase [Bacteroides sp. SM23_62_1]